MTIALPAPDVGMRGQPYPDKRAVQANFDMLSIRGSQQAEMGAGLAAYRTILEATGSHIAAKVAGTYGFGQGDPLAVTGTGTLYPLNTIYIDSANFPPLLGLAAKLRVRATLHVNDVAPTGNFTIGLHPVTRPASSGGAGLVIYTIGTAVTDSTLTFTAPAADSSNQGSSIEFAVPGNGYYVLAAVTTATVAGSSHLHLSAALETRNA